MKKIRHKGTGLYFAHGKWIEDFTSAQVFGTPVEAQRVCKEFNLKEVELVYCFGDKPTKWDFGVPLG